MRPAFRCGQLKADPVLLAVIDRPALAKALVTHFTTQPAYDGQPIRTEHEYCCIRFVVETPASRDRTNIRLEEQ